jgi:ribosomal protein L12E/L44/L45/RPP1/RPP2
MTLLRLLNVQGIAGLVVSFCLGVLLILQKGETRHWRKQSGQFEQLYRGEQVAFAGTVANYRAAAEQARAADRAAAERVQAEQEDINERSNHALDSRLADARTRARRLRVEAAGRTTDPGARGGSPMPRFSPASPGTDQATGENGLPSPPREVGTSREPLQIDDALTATEQAIQLDELIKWVRRQAAVSPNGASGAQPTVDNGASAITSRREQ